MKKIILFVLFVACFCGSSFAQTQDDKSYDPSKNVEEQIFEMMEKMTEQFGGSHFQMDTSFFKSFEQLNPENLGLGDMQFYMDTLRMDGFSDGENWMELNPENGDLNFEEMLEQMNKHLEGMGQSFNLQDLMENFNMPAIPAPDKLEKATPLDENGKPIAPKKKRKTFAL